jgi:putative peptidoglycan lipid II flippase
MTSVQGKAGESPRLLKSTSVVSAMTLLSRISGLAREMVFSRTFGASPVMDAFLVAFKIPNLLRRFFSEGAFAQAFVPVMSEYRAKRSEAETRELIDRVAGTLGLALLVITVIGVSASSVIIAVFAPGFLDGDGRYELARDMLRFTFPYLFFISLTGFAGGILNTYRRFAVPAFTPVLLNVVLIAFAAWIAPSFARPGVVLAFGVFVAGAVQLAFQVPSLMRLKFLPWPRWGWAHEGVQRILKLMLPVMFASSVAQVSLLFDTLIASFLPVGSVSWLYYSDRLMEFPLGVFGIALATVILPSLSEQHVNASSEAFSAMLDWALRLVALIAVPAALGLMLLALPVLTTIFYGGEFTFRDVAMAAASLNAYAFGLVGFILVKVLTPGYFARQDTRTPVMIAVRAFALNMVANVVFVWALIETAIAPAHVGLAAATTVSAFFNAALLLRGLLKAGVYKPAPGWRRLSLQVAAASVVMGVFLIWARGASDEWLVISGWQRAATLTACVAGGIALYFAAGYALGLRPALFRSRRHGGTQP